MNEERAREVTLLQACETAQPPHPAWSDDDRAWATRLALEEGAGDRPDAWLARRAHHALQRLVPRLPGAQRWLRRRVWHDQWIAVGVALGLVLGLLADAIGSSQRINLLAPPLWGVLAWNGVVYLLLLGQLFARAARRPTRPGLLVRWTQRAMRFAPWRQAGAARGEPGYLRLWLQRSAALATSRATTVLHAAAAALALGLIGGLYLRGLVLDYRADWESTFLSAGAAHAVLATLLAPASALSGIALPDVAAFDALRTAHGSTAPAASAAPWIHLLALTLALFVVLPRTVLAVLAAIRSRWLAARFPLPLDEPYFQRLLRLRNGDIARVRVQPYALAPAAGAADVLRQVLTPVLGDGTQVDLLPAAPFGAEDAPVPPLPADTTLAAALFDLSATPEAEHHGRYARHLAGAAPAGAVTVVMVDETAFRQRFGADSTRLAQRRDAWRHFGEAMGSLPIFIDLDTPDPLGAGRAVQLAMRGPVESVVDR